MIPDRTSGAPFSATQRFIPDARMSLTRLRRRLPALDAATSLCPKDRLRLSARVLILSLGMSLPSLPPAAAQSFENDPSCWRPPAMESGAFDKPMVFSAATSKGNNDSSVWIAASGVIGPETPERFREFLEAEELKRGQIVFHSPGGNLTAGLELGRLIRAAEIDTHVGRTVRTVESYDKRCDTWFDRVEAGVCTSSCAYAFLGGKERYVTSPAYPTEGLNQLGFHQFYGRADQGSAMLSPEQAADIEASALSVAQAITGQIVLYSIEMGVDPRIVAFAAATASDSLYFPTQDELLDLGLISVEGLGSWTMEPFGSGLVTAAKPRRSSSVLRQVTAYCLQRNASPELLLTLRRTAGAPQEPREHPLSAVEVKIDGITHSIPRRELSLRYDGEVVLVTVPLGSLSRRITAASALEFAIDAPRYIGWFREGHALDDMARRSLALAWRNCI